jgi:hypothetical protein
MRWLLQFARLSASNAATDDGRRTGRKGRPGRSEVNKLISFPNPRGAPD